MGTASHQYHFRFLAVFHHDCAVFYDAIREIRADGGNGAGM
jgi:hypothetical protein